MEYSKLLDIATDLGYELAMCGAETFRVEESVRRMLSAYDIDAEVFAIPNCLHISIEPVIGRPLTRMRRIGMHGNDLDAVERFSGLCRKICAQRPAPEIAAKWFQETRESRRYYKLPLYYLGHFLGGFGFAFLFGGCWMDGICSGLCGLLIGLIDQIVSKLGGNTFFRTIAAAFPIALLAYAFGALGLAHSPDAVTIGALMLLVPGLLFTNAMRDIIFGDTNSGINRIVQVLLIAVAIALGTAVAWNLATLLWGAPVSAAPVAYPLLVQIIPCMLACLGFAILFNIHGPGAFLCALGGVLTWSVYVLVLRWTGDDINAYFWATLFAATFSEAMARIRKYPAISYLVISIFPLIPGAGVYYAMSQAVRGNTGAFGAQDMHTAAIAGIMAVAILLVSTSVRMLSTWRRNRKKI